MGFCLQKIYSIGATTTQDFNKLGFPGSLLNSFVFVQNSQEQLLEHSSQHLYHFSVHQFLASGCFTNFPTIKLQFYALYIDSDICVHLYIQCTFVFSCNLNSKGRLCHLHPLATTSQAFANMTNIESHTSNIESQNMCLSCLTKHLAFFLSNSHCSFMSESAKKGPVTMRTSTCSDMLLIRSLQIQFENRATVLRW